MENRLHIVAPSSTHTHTIIFLHGRDSTASEFASELFESQASDDRTLPEIFPNFKWVFPTSNHRLSARFGCDLSQWFDMWSVENPEERTELQIDGLQESIGFIIDIIRRETRHVGPSHIILGGISQGCATAIHTLFHADVELGGFLGLCGWLPFQTEVERIVKQAPAPTGRLQGIRALVPSASKDSNGQIPAQDAALKVPVFLSHSEDDDVVPIKNGDALRTGLASFGMAVEWHCYEDGGHWVNEPQGVDDMVGFLTRVK